MADFEITPLEGDEENKFKEWCDTVGLLPVKLNITGRVGFPDRMVLGKHSKLLFLEFKRKGKPPRKIQAHIHKDLGKRGFKVFVVESYEDARHICERWLLS